MGSCVAWPAARCDGTDRSYVAGHGPGTPSLSEADGAAFGGLAQAMRRILVDHARGHPRDKLGAGQKAVPLDEALVFAPEQSEELSLPETSVPILQRPLLQCLGSRALG